MNLPSQRIPPEAIPEPDVSLRVSACGPRPLTINAERKLQNAHARRELLAPWKTAAWAVATKTKIKPLSTRAEVWWHPIYPKGPLPDPGATHPTTKAIMDIFTQLGVFPDDNHYHVREFPQPPVQNPNASHPLFVVEITWLAPLDGHGPGECSCAPSLGVRQPVNRRRPPKSGSCRDKPGSLTNSGNTESQ